jgi:hypothetical protein
MHVTDLFATDPDSAVGRAFGRLRAFCEIEVLAKWQTSQDIQNQVPTKRLSIGCI